MMTGLDEQTARFQALSAFTLTGYTTREAELVVNHPQRRQIVSWLMRLGSAGVVIVIVTATTSLIKSTGFDIPISLLILVGGVLLAYRLINHTELGSHWESFIRYRLIKSGLFHLEPMETVLRMRNGFVLVRIFLFAQSMLAGVTIAESNVLNRSISILGIERDERWLPLPAPDEKLMEGDRLLVFGRTADLREFAEASQSDLVPENTTPRPG